MRYPIFLFLHEQFVAFRDFDHRCARQATTEQQLAREVLREMPLQIKSYMNKKRIFPKKLVRGSVKI